MNVRAGPHSAQSPSNVLPWTPGAERRLKILAINWRDPWDPLGGGAEVHLHEILRRLVQRGHSVTWISCSYDGARSEEIAPDGIRYLRQGDWRVANLVLPWRFRQELARNSYDIVVEDLNKIPFYTPLHTHVPVLGVVPHLFGSTVFRETNPVLAAYVYLSEFPIPWVYRRCRFLAISGSTREDLVRRGIPGERVEVVHCGMDHDRFIRDDPPSRSSRPNLLSLGRLKRYKGIHVAIRALALIRNEFPDAILNVVGVRPDRPRLERLVEKCGLQGAVRFLGHLPKDAVIDLLYRSHVLLNPSPKEGWGLTVIEANECGLPVVASRRPGLMDSVRDGKTGYLAEYGDPEDFARKVLTLLKDQGLWQRFSDNAVRWARSFSWQTAAERTEALLYRLAEEASVSLGSRRRAEPVFAGR